MLITIYETQLHLKKNKKKNKLQKTKTIYKETNSKENLIFETLIKH
jgi:hypothetical protein